MIRTPSSLRANWIRFVSKIANVFPVMRRRTYDKLNWVQGTYVTFCVHNKVGRHVVIKRIASVTDFIKRPIYI